MRQLTILSGAGINLSLASVGPEAQQLLELAYNRVSAAVFQRLPPNVQALFNPNSFDFILGGLLTVNLAIERIKDDLNRFGVDPNAFAQLFHQSTVQGAIIHALDAIEQQLTIPLDQMLPIVDQFTPAVDRLFQKYDSINYFTVNFDGIFDHILYGRYYVRGQQVTDFWTGNGTLNRWANTRAKIFHLHGDLRYKPFKKTSYNNPPYQWPVVVVGDNPVKLETIRAYEALTFYGQRFTETCSQRGPFNTANDLAVIGFGFRDEDHHIRAPLWDGMCGGVFSSISVFDTVDHLGPNPPFAKRFYSANGLNLVGFLEALGQ